MTCSKRAGEKTPSPFGAGNDILNSSGLALPRRGYATKPRVAASATVGTESKRVFNRKAVASVPQIMSGRNRVAVVGYGLSSFPRVAEARQPWALMRSPFGASAKL